MNKRGVTILELLISISLISVVMLLLLKLIFSLDNINSAKDYASDDEINRTTIIKNIESDFLKYELKGLKINKLDDSLIISLEFMESKKELIIKDKSLVYDDTEYKLNSKNATYSLCPSYKYQKIDNSYYLVSLNIPVLIDNKNNTNIDDISLSYIGLIGNNNYPDSFICTK